MKSMSKESRMSGGPNKQSSKIILPDIDDWRQSNVYVEKVPNVYENTGVISPRNQITTKRNETAE